MRALADTLSWLVGALARDTRLWSDDVWVVDYTPVECARSREPVHRSAGRLGRVRPLRQPLPLLQGASPGPAVHPAGLPLGFSLSGAKVDEREVLLGILDADPTLSAGRSAQTVIGDWHHYGRTFEATLNGHGITLLRPTRTGEAPRPESACSSRCDR